MKRCQLQNSPPSARRRRFSTRHHGAFAMIAVGALLISACGDSDDSPDSATASFDGETCTYDGPTEFDLNTEATFSVTNTSNNNSVGFSLWKVPDGSTVADVEENTIFGVAPDGFDEMRAARFEGQNLIGDEHDIVVSLDTTGTWILNCWNPLADRPATAFEVAGSELTAVVENYVAAYNTGDVDAVVGFFSDEAVMINHPFDRLVEGQEELRAVLLSDINASDQSGQSYEVFNFRATDNTVTWDHVWNSNSGRRCRGTSNSATVENSKITDYKFSTFINCA